VKLKELKQMFSLEILLLGLALAIDAAVVTFAVALIHQELKPLRKFKRGLIISGAFGIFQALMLWLGAYTGYLFTFSNFGYFFQLAVGIIFLALALKFIQESISLEERKIEWGVIPIIILAFATSIDAFASGISLGSLPHSYFISIEIGLITFLICGSFYWLGQFFKEIPDRWLLRIAALIFLFLSVDILWSFRYLLQGIL
jgi:manganese efflux pump family protein